MPAGSSDVFELLRQWRQATESEGAAIQQAAWGRMAECQEAKRRLRSLIESGPSSLLPAPCSMLSAPLDALVAELVGLEQRNLEALGQKMREVRRQQTELEHAGRTLKHLHRAYAPAAPPAWQSYS